MYLIDFLGVFDSESDILDTVTVLAEVLVKLGLSLVLEWTIRGGESECDLIKFIHVA